MFVRALTRKIREKEMNVRVNDELVRTQYVILNILKMAKATNHMQSMTLDEISEREGRSKKNTLYKHIRILQERGYIELGAKVEKAYGYYLSKSALELLNKYTNMEEK